MQSLKDPSLRPSTKVLAYKIIAKALHIRIQFSLPELIFSDQTTFVPNKSILDNVLVSHEVIEWAKISNQDLVLLKLGFKKAYDTVNHKFLFEVLEKIGFPPKFLTFVRLLFTNTSASVLCNGLDSKDFDIQRGVRQGCPLAPYLFLFVGEALNAAIKHLTEEGALSGINLPNSQEQQVIIQNADDTNFTVKGTKSNLLTLTRVLELFHIASGLQLNWHKSVA